MRRYWVLIATVFALAVPGLAHSCPLIDGMVDFNCDQKIRIAATGDSIVKGIMDERNDGRGGWVKRLRKSFPNADISNIGVSGVSSRQLFRKFRKYLPRAGRTLKKSRERDLFFISVGSNDRWEEESPEAVIRNIKRLIEYLKKDLAQYSHSPPYFVVTTITPNNRGFQRDFVNSVNRLLLVKKSPNLPVYLRLDNMSPDIISYDGIHPDSRGYSQIAKKVAKFIKNLAQNKMSNKRHDNDGDGIYNFFEANKYFTNQDIADTDGDGKSDGEEVFETGTDPLVVD